MKKNCLLITSPFRPNIGGVETHLDDLISAGAKRGVNFTVITYQPLVTEAKGEYKEVGNNYTIYRIPWPRFNLFLRLEKLPALEFFYLFPGLFLGGLIYLLLNSRDVSVIHAQGLVAGVAGFFLGKLFGLKTIVSTHSVYSFPQNGLYSKFVKFLFSNVYAVLTLSKQSKEEVQKLGVPESKIHIFTYWVDQKVFKQTNKSEARKEIKLPLNRFLCLFVGRLVPVKGVRELLEAAKLTREIIFVIAGDGPLVEEVKESAKENHNVIFIGPLNKKELAICYNAADVLIVPSIHDEGFGRVILESLSSGTPVIGSDRGAIPEALDAKVGILIDINPLSIKKTVEHLAQDRIRLQLLAKNARSYAISKFSEKNADAIIKHYEV